MIISNKKHIETIGAFLMFLIPFILMVMIFQFVIVKKIDAVIIIFLILMMAVIMVLYNLRYKEIENSGFVLTVKKKHPIFGKGFVFPKYEFPVDLLEDFHVKGQTVFLDLGSGSGTSGKIRRIKIELKGFNTEQRNEIIKSLADGKKNTST